ncbi:MAG: HIT family hydrolase [Desulfurococcales archaeon ex4484_58]|nr:MAG: HIT family hydrolase [Desulfurococcales archaeon ex4484_58]
MENHIKILWNPWRFEYVKDSIKQKGACILCELPKKGDEESYILYRGKHAYIVLNAYPYNTGHLMIVPYKHIGNLEELGREELVEIMDLTVKSIKVLKKSYNPDGFNIGVNIGRAAGAGIADHVHVHIVPRWVGDTSFIVIFSATKNLPQSLDETYKLLKDTWKEIFSDEEALDH